MSIYPVKIDKWYNKKSSFKTEIKMLKTMLPYLRCVECGGKIEWSKGYVMHSITFGGPDESWCSLECLKGIEA